MRFYHLRGTLLGGVGVLCLLGCVAEQSETEEIASSSEALVNTSYPKYTTSTTSTLPAIGHGTLTDPGDTNVSAEYAHEGSYTDYYDLGAAPKTTTDTAWAQAASSDQYASSTAFQSTLLSAHNSATSRAPGLVASPDHPSISYTTKSWSPVEGRWLRSKWVRPPRSIVERLQSYPDPHPVSDIRERGARLFCSARDAQFRQGNHAMSMGGINIGAFTLLGREFVPVRMEPLVSLQMDANSKHMTSSSDGAQAFDIPLALGVRTNFFGLGRTEARFPATILAGDSEVATRANRRCIKKSFLGGCTYDYDRTYGSSTHASAVHVASASSSYKSPKFKLLEFGFARLFISGSSSQSFGLSTENDRVIAKSSPYLTARAGDELTNPLTNWLYDTRPWTAYSGIRGYYTGFDGETVTAPWLVGPTETRANQDDDHHTTFDSVYSVSFKPELEAGLNVGPVDVTVTTTGELKGTAIARHDISDSINLQDIAKHYDFGSVEYDLKHVYADLAVRPRVEAGLTLQILVRLKIAVDVWFGSITIVDKNVIDTGSLSLAHWDSEDEGVYKEDASLRIGYSDDTATAMKQPVNSRSHLVGAGEYKAFASTNVDQCLADPEPPPAGPGPCNAESSPTTAPRAGFCLYEQVHRPASGTFCSAHQPDNFAWYVNYYYPNETNAQRACRQAYFDYLCRDEERLQVYEGTAVQAHALPATFMDANDPDATVLHDTVQQCASAFFDHVPTQAEQTAWTDSFFKPAFCDPDATLIGPVEAFEVENASTAPTPDAPSSSASNCE